MLHNFDTRSLFEPQVIELERADDDDLSTSRADIAEQSANSLKYVSFITMVIYAALSVVHIYSVPAPLNSTMFSVAALTSLTMFCIYISSQRLTFSAPVANAFIYLIGLLALSNTVIHTVLLGEEKNIVNFVLVAAGVSLVFLSWRALLSFYFLTIASFSWTIQFIEPSPDYVHQYFILGSGCALGILSIAVRRNSMKHLITARKLAQSKSKRLEGALDKARRGIKAQQDNHSKSNFLAHMSHELRTPLTAIIGFSDIIRRKMFGSIGNDRYADYIDDIYASSEHLLSLVNDLLDLSKLEANMVDVNRTITSLDATLERSLSMVRERAQRKNISLQYSKLPDDLEICSDPLRMKQVVLNLLSNAVKFTPNGGSITLEPLVDMQGIVRIAVRDTGVGMTADEIENAMEPFWQAKAYRSSPDEGTGLGLALSKELAVLLGGDLEIESTPGVGTTVHFSLPVDFTDPEAEGTDEYLISNQL